MKSADGSSISFNSSSCRTWPFCLIADDLIVRAAWNVAKTNQFSFNISCTNQMLLNENAIKRMGTLCLGIVSWSSTRCLSQPTQTTFGCYDSRRILKSIEIWDHWIIPIEGYQSGWQKFVLELLSTSRHVSPMHRYQSNPHLYPPKRFRVRMKNPSSHSIYALFTMSRHSLH